MKIAEPSPHAEVEVLNPGQFGKGRDSYFYVGGLNGFCTRLNDGQYFKCNVISKSFVLVPKLLLEQDK